MITNRSAVSTTFREGDDVVLAEGTYQGTLGVFVRFRQDVTWGPTSRSAMAASAAIRWRGWTISLRRRSSLNCRRPKKPLENWPWTRQK